MARKFIEERLEQYRIEKAVELYVNEKGSLKEISKITGVTVRMIMETLRKKNIPLRMGAEVFDRGMKYGSLVIPVKLISVINQVNKEYPFKSRCMR